MLKQSIRILLSMLTICAAGVLIIALLSVSIIIIPDKRESGVYNGKRISINSFDGTELIAYDKTPSHFGHRWVLLIHSYRSDHTFMNPYAERYLEKGYNVIQPDNRAHGESGGAYIGMGYLDQFDILCWINYIIEQDPDAEIVLHGVSMGASALMMLSGQDNLPLNIRAIIEDCGYKSAKDYLSWKLRHKFHMPAIPMLPIANLAIKTMAGYYLYDASAIEGVKRSQIPILFIHGTEDQTVPVDDVYELYEAANCIKDLMIVDHAGHGESLSIAKEEYWNRIDQFIN